jgi:hypothetical protein
MIAAAALAMSLEAPRRQIGSWVEAWMVRICPIGPKAQRTTIDLDDKQVLRIGSRFPAREALHETNASAPVFVDTQPVLIKWGAEHNRRIAVYKNEHPHLPEQDFSSGHEFSGLAPGRYYFKITYPNGRYTSLHLEVLSQASSTR